ncbi:MAG TPA: hypothetical protein VMT75_07130 [Candidatus Saccharimonadales bacterium]|nr:hypothetical protein [Candidatus Saccharimonadales bacterium]
MDSNMGVDFPPGRQPPWLNERGEFLPGKLPLDATLARAISGDKRECREAVGVLRMMQQSGRVEAGIYLMGLLAAAPDDWEWRTAIVEALHGFDIEGCARLLFSELRAVKGSNTTRRYRDAVLKTLATLSVGLTRAGFAAMLEDPTCSQRTRDKVCCILDGVDDR